MLWIAMIGLGLGIGVAAAQEEEALPPSDLPTVLEDAEAIGTLSRSEVRWLKPKRHRLPQNPYAHTDFTAYTLEQGETELGLMNVRVGLLPSVQVGSAPLLNVLGVYNGQIKLHALHAGPVDLAASMSHYRHDGGLTGRYTAASLTTSVQIRPPWSVHLSGGYLSGRLSGVPSVEGTLPSTVAELGGWDLDAWRQEAIDQGLDLNLEAEVITARFATDIRFNRRDSLILQGQAALWGSIHADAGDIAVPPELGLGSTLETDEAGAIPLSEAYSASAAWQWSGKRTYLRLGAGISSAQGAWLMQSTELGMRLGGETRREERVLRHGWRHNRRLLRQGADSTVASSPEPRQP